MNKKPLQYCQKDLATVAANIYYDTLWKTYIKVHTDTKRSQIKHVLYTWPGDCTLQAMHTDKGLIALINSHLKDRFTIVPPKQKATMELLYG